MPWVKIESEQEVDRGIAVNTFGALDQSPWNVAVVVGISNGEVFLARPIAYANADCNNKAAAVYCENWSLPIASLLKRAVMWKENGKTRAYRTKASE